MHVRMHVYVGYVYTQAWDHTSKEAVFQALLSVEAYMWVGQRNERV